MKTMSYVDEQVMHQIQYYKDKGYFEDALSLANKVLMKDPQNDELLLEVADILYLKGDIEKAEKPVNYLLDKKNYNDPMWFYVKWVLDMEKTEWKKARENFKKSLSLCSEDNPEMLRCFWLSEYWLGNREKGITFLESAFESSETKDAEIIYNLVEIYLLEHNYERAWYFIDYYYKNRDNLNTFGKDKSYYDNKIDLFYNYLNTIE